MPKSAAPDIRIVILSDLHYCRSLSEEVAANRHRLPADEYDHMVNGHLYWHNELLVEEMGSLLARAKLWIEKQQPDLVICLGDLVNTNWVANVADVAEQLSSISRPVQVVTGNHDIYFDGPESRLQQSIAADANPYTSGIRHEPLDGIDLIFLDVFAVSARGEYRKFLFGGNEMLGLDYRPQDIARAQEILDDNPDRPFLIFGHFPLCPPNPRIDGPGRRIGWRWPGGVPLCHRLQQPTNLVGVICGHQHFAHLQVFEHGFHWTVPALVEYPCTVARLDISEAQIHGSLYMLAPELASRSLAHRQQTWTFGEPGDREFEFPLGP